MTVQAPTAAFPSRVELVLDNGQRLSGYVRGHALDAAQDVYTANRNYEAGYPN